MFGFLKRMFEKNAQHAIERRARELAPDKAPRTRKGAAGTASAAGPKAKTARDAAIARMQAQVKGVITPERQALLANAMAVHRAKQKILADLDDESRAKLVAMAITTLLHQDDKTDKTKK